VLHAREWGDPRAPAVVCLHGVVAHGGRFRRLAEERLAARHRVLSFDLRGHGRSEWEPPWDLATHVEDVLETAGRLGVERAVWLGHSFGGRLVLEIAARVPERVAAMVLLDPAIWVPPPMALERAERSRWEVAYTTVEEAIAARVGSGGVELTPRSELEEEMREHLVESPDGRLRFRYSQSAVVAAFGEMAKPPPALETLSAPTLLVRGADSEVVPDLLLEVVQEGLGALLEVVTVPGGHVVLWDAFDETADAIEQFLGRTAGLASAPFTVS